jgi:hypothetical protein
VRFPPCQVQVSSLRQHHAIAVHKKAIPQAADGSLTYVNESLMSEPGHQRTSGRA